MTRSKRIRIFITITVLIALIIFLKPHKYFQDFSDIRLQLSPLPKISLDQLSVDWKKFAYVQYVTNLAYLCNAVMIFESLHRLGTRAELLMMYPSRFKPDGDSEESRLLSKARDVYGVKLTPVEVQRRSGNDATWAESYTKLLAFNQTQYQRVLCLDSDSTILQLMDELFLLPPSPVAMPRAYWLDGHILSSQIVLIQPSRMEFERISKAIDSAGPNDYDMEIINNLYGDSALIIPHRPYDLLTSAFRNIHTERYLGNEIELWDPDVALKEAKFLHFSDWPVPKPWLPGYQKMDELKPACNDTGHCKGQTLWFEFYSDFARRREEICVQKPNG